MSMFCFDVSKSVTSICMCILRQMSLEGGSERDTESFG